jgi:hypothetical protein
MKDMSKQEKLLLSSGGESVRCGAPCDHTTVGGRAWVACKRSLPRLPRHSPPVQLSPGGAPWRRWLGLGKKERSCGGESKGGDRTNRLGVEAVQAQKK